ncbi:hypothetical protein MY1884_006700 [Beauveria asiatica]
MKFLAIAAALATAAVAADVAASGAAGAAVTQIGDGQIQVGTQPAGQQPTPQPAPGTPAPAGQQPTPQPAPGTPAPANPAPANPAPANPAPANPAPANPAPAESAPAPLVSCEPSTPGVPGVPAVGPGTVLPPPIGTGSTTGPISPINTQPVVAGAGRIAGGAVAAVAVAVALL